MSGRTTRTTRLTLASIAMALFLIGCSRIGRTTGQSVVLDVTAMPMPGQKLTPSVLAQGEQALRARAAVLGANPSDVAVIRKGNKYTIDIPGVSQARARSLYDAQGRLEFFCLSNVNNDLMSGRERFARWTMTQSGSNYSFVDTRTPSSRTLTDPIEIRNRVIGLTTKPVLSGKDLVPNGASLQYGPGSNVIVALQFKPQAIQAFADFTRYHVNDFVAITLDDKILTAPIIREAIPGNPIISGNYTVAKGQEQVDLLNAGELPFVPKVTSVYGASVRRIP